MPCYTISMKRKYFFIIPACIICGIVLFAALFILTLTIFEYRPKAIEEVPFTKGSLELEQKKELSIISWNIGYAGLGKDEDFFMDGGKKVRPKSKKVVEKYLEGIKETLAENPSDIIFLQEIDINSKRSYRVNEFNELIQHTKKAGSFAYNYNSLYVPYPLPTLGHVEAGLSTLTSFKTDSAERVSLPVSFSWPVRLVNLKRCLLVTRLPVYKDGISTGKEVVLVNFHLEAYDNGEGKIAQTKALKEFITSEYKKGNYVIAGGDFNQTFAGAKELPVILPDGWLPGKIDSDLLEDGWQLAFDDSIPTCRSDDAEYNNEDAKNHKWQYYLIDGFILSPNIEKTDIRVIDEDFQNSDHNPVYMTFKLL